MKDRLKLLRRTLGLTQRALAERLELTTSNVGNWELGIYDIPPARKYQLCREFGVRREWLERGEGEMLEPELTTERALANAAKALFSELSDGGKKAVLDALRDQLSRS